MFGLGIVEILVLLAVAAIPICALVGLIAVAIQIGRKGPKE